MIENTKISRYIKALFSPKKIFLFSYSFFSRSFDLIKKFFIHYFPNNDTLKAYIWNFIHFPQFIFFINKIRKKVSPKENIFSFYFNLLKFKKLYYSKEMLGYFDDLNVKQETLVASVQNKKPGLILVWHHGIQGFHYKRRFVPKMVIFSALPPYPGNENFFKLTKENYIFSLAAMLKFFEQGKFVAASFDGSLGGEKIPSDILGVRLNFPRGLMQFIKKFEVPIYTFAIYKKEKSFELLMKKPLFAGDEYKNMTEEDILQKIIDQFEKDLMQNGKYQINYWWLFRRFYEVELEPGTRF